MCQFDNQKSTSGYVFTYVGRAILWRSKFQERMALSTTEVKYIVASEAAKEAMVATTISQLF